MKKRKHEVVVQGGQQPKKSGSSPFVQQRTGDFLQGEERIFARFLALTTRPAVAQQVQVVL